MRYLVTGAAGFIGSSIAKELLRRGHTVVGIDNLAGGNVQNIRGLGPQFEWHMLNLNDIHGIRESLYGVDAIFHQAAIASVPRSVNDPIGTNHANLNATVTLLKLAKDCGIRRIVFASSSAIYGSLPELPKTEEMMPSPETPYAVQKLSCEHYMSCFHTLHGLETVMLRYFNVFGPHQSADSPYSGVIARFTTDLLSGQTPTIHGDGMQSRDFTYIDDVVAANLLAADAPSENVAGKVFNIGTGKSHTVLELFQELSQILGSGAEPRFAPQRNGDIRDSVADITRAQNMLGYRPRTSFRDGLQYTTEWYCRQYGAVTSLTAS